MVSGTMNKQLLFCSIEPSSTLEAELEMRVQEGVGGEKWHLSKAKPLLFNLSHVGEHWVLMSQIFISICCKEETGIS